MIKRDEIATQISCLNRADDDEPLFVLRANDENAPAIVMEWMRVYIRSKGGVPNLSGLQLAKAREAEQIASDMRVWKMRNQKP
jgi:hypothetical protein